MKKMRREKIRKSGSPDDEELDDLIKSASHVDIVHGQSVNSNHPHADVPTTESDDKLWPVLPESTLNSHTDAESTNNQSIEIDPQQRIKTEILDVDSSTIELHGQVTDSFIKSSNTPKDANGGTAFINRKLNRSLISSKDEVLAVRSKTNASKLSLGNGLLVYFEKNERISFQYRLSENGRDTTRKIGDFNAMSIEKAREEAKKFHDLTLQTRRLRAYRSFKGMLEFPVEVTEISPKKNVGKKHKCFDSMNDFLKFLEYLLSDNGIDASIKASIVFLFLLPIHPRELFKAQWKDFQGNDLLVIPAITQKSTDRSSYSDLVSNVRVCLSSQAWMVLKLLDPHEIKRYTFPDSFILSRHLCPNEQYDERFLTRWMSEVFISFKIVPSQFVNFFSDVALEFDLFKEDAIYDFVKFASLPHRGPTDPRKVALMLSLIRWWGDLLELKSPALQKYLHPKTAIFETY